MSASLPNALSKSAYTQIEAPKLRNSVNNADLIKSDKVGSFQAHGKKSPSAYSNTNPLINSRQDPSSNKKMRTASSQDEGAKASAGFEGSNDVCHSNMVTNGPKKGGGKGKSQLTLYINSRPPNGECETAHEVSLEEERS